MKYLITGVPGTGKTEIGKYLQSEEGFEHIDYEKTFEMYGQATSTIFNNFIQGLGDKKVITWGFMPGADDNNIKILQDIGYKMIWFDGNRKSALREFLKRGDVEEELFHAQIARIEKMDLNKFNPTKINTFDESGNFLKKSEISKLILDQCL